MACLNPQDLYSHANEVVQILSDTFDKLTAIADKYNLDRCGVIKLAIAAMQKTAENDVFWLLLSAEKALKCAPPDGVTIKPDGKHPLDPCEYEVKEIHRNVTVEVIRCRKCGHTEISWRRQEDTEDF